MFSYLPVAGLLMDETLVCPVPTTRRVSILNQWRRLFSLPAVDAPSSTIGIMTVIAASLL